MAILNITCVRPLVARAIGPYFYKVDILTSYGLSHNWSSDCYRSSEQVEYKKAVWLRMLETIQRLSDKATSANIRAEMGWGVNAKHSHCDYFSTLKRIGMIKWKYKRVDNNQKPVYYLTSMGKNTLEYNLSQLPKAMAKAEKRGTQRITEDQYREKIVKRIMAAKKAQIRAEAKNGKTE